MENKELKRKEQKFLNEISGLTQQKLVKELYLWYFFKFLNMKYTLFLFNFSLLVLPSLFYFGTHVFLPFLVFSFVFFCLYYELFYRKYICTDESLHNSYIESKNNIRLLKQVLKEKASL